jgi:hypothetical protein
MISSGISGQARIQMHTIKHWDSWLDLMVCLRFFRRRRLTLGRCCSR